MDIMKFLFPTYILNIYITKFLYSIPIGYSDESIMAAGRWQSKAFMAYTKMPRLHRAKFAANLVTNLGIM